MNQKLKKKKKKKKEKMKKKKGEEEEKWRKLIKFQNLDFAKFWKIGLDNCKGLQIL